MATKKTSKKGKAGVKSTKKTTSKKKLLVKNPPVEPSEEEIRKLTEDMLGVEDVAPESQVFEILIPPAFVGETIEGAIYVATHTCPICEAAVETLGAGYPMMRCSQCGVPLRVTRTRVKDES